MAKTFAAADTLSQRMEQLAPAMSVTKPDGAAPFPAVVLLHGCGGRQPFLDRYAEVIRNAGAAAVIVDSFKPRQINKYMAYGTVCTGIQLWGRQRAGDLFAALAWVRAQPWADRDRLLAAGWSHGGWTILDALALRPGPEMRRATGIVDLPNEPLQGLVGCFLAYPYAGRASFAGRRPWRLSPHATAIVGGRDYIVGTAAPHSALKRLKGLGAPINIHLFENATHAFDVPEAIDVRVRYDAKTTADSEKLLTQLIARVR